MNFANHGCHCDAVVKELLARTDKSGSTPGDAVFCFLVVLFLFLFCFFPSSSVWSPFFNTIFPSGVFSFILTTDLAGHARGSIYIFSLSPEFYLGTMGTLKSPNPRNWNSISLLFFFFQR